MYNISTLITLDLFILTRPLPGTASGMASDSVRSRGSESSERQTIFMCPHTLKFRTRPLVGTTSGMASDSVHGRGSECSLVKSLIFWFQGPPGLRGIDGPVGDPGTDRDGLKGQKVGNSLLYLGLCLHQLNKGLFFICLFIYLSVCVCVYICMDRWIDR